MLSQYSCPSLAQSENMKSISLGVLAGGVLLSIILKKHREISFRNRVALVTGGSRGLGLILAEKLAAQGAQVAICARDAQELLKVEQLFIAKGLRVSTFKCDVTREDEVKQLMSDCIQKLGRLDILVNNAGIIQVGPAEAMDLGDYHEAMNVNFWGTVHCSLSALPFLLQPNSGRRSGRIVNITSIGGTVAVPHLLPYSASKFACVGFSEAFGIEVAKLGVRVTTVVPGLMRTGSFLNALFKGNRENEFKWFALASSMPGLSIDAEKAASQILEACQRGDSFLTISYPAKIARLANACFPQIARSLASTINRLLPSPRAGYGESSVQVSKPGYLYRTKLSSPPVTWLGDLAAVKFNEKVA